MASYFCDLKPIGLKANLTRHSEEEKRILAAIELLKQEESADVRELYLRSYYGFLDKLRASKAELSSKIGKK
jgi:hypothetical protein